MLQQQYYSMSSTGGVVSIVPAVCKSRFHHGSLSVRNSYTSPPLSPVVLYNFRTFGRWQAFGLLVTSGAYYICYQGLVEAARMGVTGGTYFDILAVCLVGQAVSTFTSYGVYIYALVRGP